MYLLFYLHLTESLYLLTTQNKVLTITTLHQSSDNPATTRRSPGPNRLWAQQFGEFAFSLKKPFSAYFDYARLILFFALHFSFLGLGYPQFLLFMPSVTAVSLSLTL